MSGFFAFFDLIARGALKVKFLEKYWSLIDSKVVLSKVILDLGNRDTVGIEGY